MNKALCCNGVLLILYCAPLKAQETVDELPSIAFLEYLAEMKEIDGKLYGPQDINLEPCQRLIPEREEKHNETTNEASIESNGGQNNKAQKSGKTAIEQGCKRHD